MATITVSPLTSPLPRDELGEFLPSKRAILSFEATQTDVTVTLPDAIRQIVDLTNALLAAPYITWADTPTLEDERTLTVTSTLQITNTGSQVILGLAETGFAAGFYGSATQTVGVSVDLYGRVTGVEVYDLLSDNVAEGVANLYFTEARARAALTGGTGISYTAASGTIALADTAVTPGSYGSATAIPILVIDQQGRVTGASAAPIPTLDQGTYTPTLAPISNIGALTAFPCTWQRIGDQVTVSGYLEVSPTAATTMTRVGISLPIPSNLATFSDCTGVAKMTQNADGAAVIGDDANDRAQLQWPTTVTGPVGMTFAFTYRVL